MAERALLVWGGWEGHQPRQTIEIFVPFLEEHGFEVLVENRLSVYADEQLMSSLALIVQNWTMGELAPEELEGLLRTVGNGAGLAGWHGGLCDAFRRQPAYQFLTGAQWLAHPNGSSARYRVDIPASAGGDPIVEGIDSFAIVGEQYYLAVDPTIEALATTTFRAPVEAPWIPAAVIPAAWRRRWDRGRVFYVSWGHTVGEFDVPEARTIFQRGLLWAAGRQAG